MNEVCDDCQDRAFSLTERCFFLGMVVHGGRDTHRITSNFRRRNSFHLETIFSALSPKSCSMVRSSFSCEIDLDMKPSICRYSSVGKSTA